MSNNSTQLSFWNPAEEESTSSPQGSLDHAKTSHMQDGKQEFMQTVQDYSLKFSASPMRSMPLAELDPSSCWRTCQQSLLETEEIGEELYMESWPKDTLILNRKLYQQSKWEHYTKETDGGVSASQKWATPTANPSISASVEALQKEAKRLHPKGFYTLGTLVATMFPTPTVQDAKNNGGPSQFRRNSLPLNAVVHQTTEKFPTPNALQGHNSGRLDEWGGSDNPFRGTEEGKGQLNPRWVSWLMGLPENWCNVDPIGGPKNPTSQESQQESQNESQN